MHGSADSLIRSKLQQSSEQQRHEAQSRHRPTLTRPKGMPGLNSRQHKEVGLVVMFGSEGLGLKAPCLSRLRAARGCWLDLGSERRGFDKGRRFSEKGAQISCY
jgi:hypothetical protein